MKNLKYFIRQTKYIFLAAIFFWNQLALATSQGTISKAAPAGLEALKEKLSESSKARKDSPIAHLYQQHRAEFPQDFRREMDYRIKQLGAAGLAKPEVESVGKGKSQVLRMRFKDQRDSVTVQVSANGDMELIGNMKGQSQRRKISKAEVTDPMKLLEILTGEKRTITQVSPSIQLMSAKQLSLLTEEKRKAYIDWLRSTLATAEKAQQELAGAGVQTSGAPFWWFNEAIAAGPSGPCIVAGWVGQYENGSCKYKDAVQSSGGVSCIQCNSAIYSSGCISLDSRGRAPSDATAQCNSQTARDKYFPFNGIKNQAEFDEKMRSLETNLVDLDVGCRQTLNNKKAVKDQPPTCSALMSRVAELRAANCQLLEAQKGSNPNFANLTCVEPLPPEPQPEPPPADEEEPGETPGADGCLKSTSSECKKARRDGDCGPGGTAEAICCQDAKGATIQKYYCSCGPGTTPQYNNSVRPVRCEQETSGGGIDNDRRERRERRERKEPSWWDRNGSTLLAMAAVIGVAGLAFYYIPKMDPWNTPPLPTPGPLAPPPTGGVVTTPNGNPVPIIRGTR